jgi:hypothetical protein
VGQAAGIGRGRPGGREERRRCSQHSAGLLMTGGRTAALLFQANQILLVVVAEAFEDGGVGEQMVWDLKW